jgi:hypothetical protein
MTAIYQAASRFWELQFVQFAIIADIGLVLLLAAGSWVRARST